MIESTVRVRSVRVKLAGLISVLGGSDGHWEEVPEEEVPKEVVIVSLI